MIRLNAFERSVIAQSNESLKTLYGRLENINLRLNELGPALIHVKKAIDILESVLAEVPESEYKTFDFSYREGLIKRK